MGMGFDIIVIVDPHQPMIKDLYHIVMLVLSHHRKTGDIYISYFSFYVSISPECNLTASSFPAVFVMWKYCYMYLVNMKYGNTAIRKTRNMEMLL